jgi:hypothetical protein
MAIELSMNSRRVKNLVERRQNQPFPYYLVFKRGTTERKNTPMERESESEFDKLPPLVFSEGWKDILTSPDAADYQQHFEDLVRATQQHVLAEWTQDKAVVERRWQLLIERIVYLAIGEDDIYEMSQSEAVETAFITLTTNLESMGWVEEGKSVLIPDLAQGEGGEGQVLDITEL